MGSQNRVLPPGGAPDGAGSPKIFVNVAYDVTIKCMKFLNDMSNGSRDMTSRMSAPAAQLRVLELLESTEKGRFLDAVYTVRHSTFKMEYLGNG